MTWGEAATINALNGDNLGAKRLIPAEEVDSPETLSALGDCAFLPTAVMRIVQGVLAEEQAKSEQNAVSAQS